MKIIEEAEFETHGVLMVGWAFEGTSELADGPDTLDGLVDAVPGLELLPCADMENSGEDDLDVITFVYGVRILTSMGDANQEAGLSWEELKTKLVEARGTCAALHSSVAPHFTDLPELETHLCTGGWLASVTLLKGEWDESIDYEEQEAFEGSYGSKDSIYLYYGTDGPSQDPYPNGGVRGVFIAGESFDCAASSPVELNDDTNAKLDAILDATGIRNPRYFLLTRYD